MSEKGWGKTVLGWFVVQNESEASAENLPADDADALIQKYADQPTPNSPVSFSGPLPNVVDGHVDFGQVYEAAGVDAEERGRVERAQTLLSALPAGTPIDAKKQIVEASLRAFGVPTEKIIEAAVAEIEALEAYILEGQGETQRLLADGSQRISALEQSIQEIRFAMEQAVNDQEQRARATNHEKLAIQTVLEFFGQEAVLKVVRDSPKLHEPPSR